MPSFSFASVYSSCEVHFALSLLFAQSGTRHRLLRSIGPALPLVVIKDTRRRVQIVRIRSSAARA